MRHRCLLLPKGYAETFENMDNHVASISFLQGLSRIRGVAVRKVQRAPLLSCSGRRYTDTTHDSMKILGMERIGSISMDDNGDSRAHTMYLWKLTSNATANPSPALTCPKSRHREGLPQVRKVEVMRHGHTVGWTFSSFIIPSWSDIEDIHAEHLSDVQEVT